MLKAGRMGHEVPGMAGVYGHILRNCAGRFRGNAGRIRLDLAARAAAARVRPKSEHKAR
jgi:hypothetical protein